MNKNFKAGNQGGFTLIELIVVIVILGILAATALPKFANLSSDARGAALSAAKASISSVSAMGHARALVNPAAGTITLEGTDLSLKNGYPDATDGADFMAAAGLSADDFTSDTATADQISFSPKGVAAAGTCNVTYKNAASATAVPTITITKTNCD